MRKITTLYKKNPENLAFVTSEVNNENLWVFKGEGIATRKFDGTAAAIINGELYKRYDVKKGRQIPADAIPCQEPDEITGHHPHWVKCNPNDKSDKYFFEGFYDLLAKNNIYDFDKYSIKRLDGSYELCGEKVQGNPEKIMGHKLIKHGSEVLYDVPLYFDLLKEYFLTHDIEGIVFHHPDGRMCKIRKSDFGIKR